VIPTKFGVKEIEFIPLSYPLRTVFKVIVTLLFGSKPVITAFPIASISQWPIEGKHSQSNKESKFTISILKPVRKAVYVFENSGFRPTRIFTSGFWGIVVLVKDFQTSFPLFLTHLNFTFPTTEVALTFEHLAPFLIEGLPEKAFDDALTIKNIAKRMVTPMRFINSSVWS
jgi:hypothetical protein